MTNGRLEINPFLHEPNPPPPARTATSIATTATLGYYCWVREATTTCIPSTATTCIPSPPWFEPDAIKCVVNCVVRCIPTSWYPLL
jgi:hypothetical protein